MMKKVFLCEFIHPEAYDYLKSNAEIISSWDRWGEADAIIDRNFKVTAELMDSAKMLRVIGVHGTGTDDIDLEAARQRGIQVFSVPRRNAQSVAEMNVALMLALGRKIVLANRRLEQSVGKEQGNMFAQLQGTEFHGKTLGLIGIGDISRRTAVICQNGFAMKTIGWSRHLSDVDAKTMNIEKCASMDDVFEKADVIVIGLSLESSTERLIGKKQFDKMKRGAILINSTRGAILDEGELYDALKEGTFSGAACDVFVEEPLQGDNPLLSLDNFIGTPHLGANTDEALKRVGMAVVEGVLDRLESE